MYSPSCTGHEKHTRKNVMTESEIGAEPVTINRTRPPNLAAILENYRMNGGDDNMSHTVHDNIEWIHMYAHDMNIPLIYPIYHHLMFLMFVNDIV